MDSHSLTLLEFDRVTDSIAACAESDEAREALAAARPIDDASERAAENARLAEAIRRATEPGPWIHVGSGRLDELIAHEGAPGPPLDGPALRRVASWLSAARLTRAAWEDAEQSARHPSLARLVGELPRLDALEKALDKALDDDGNVRDGASPRLARARAELKDGERDLERKLDRWARGFGEGSYVTRHADRFVALVPAAGFPRRLGIVHDVSSSGQSLFVEPLEACEANNRLMEQRAVALEEERRILRELEQAVHAAGPELETLRRVAVHLDSLGARARWANARKAVALNPEGEVLALRGARHPLLVDALGLERVVPLELRLNSDARAMLVSGPNMGGKSVALKTVGLACALAHAAMPVPAEEGSRVPELSAILVDLGDEQSIAQGLSTFAAHLKTLATMAREAGRRTLLLCDELGAGTDPDEGAPLAQALLEHFVARGAWAVMTTHLGSLKRAAGSIPGVTSAAMEFDDEELGPRYRLVPGIPGASRALATAERFGLDAALIARARALTSDGAREVERLLLELERVRREWDDERMGLAEARERVEEAEKGLHAAEERTRASLAELRSRLTRESETLLARARELWQDVHRESRKAEKRLETSARLREEIASVERATDELKAAAERAAAEIGGAPATQDAPPPALERGARVLVRDLEVEAEIVGEPDAEGRVELRRGAWTIHSHVSRLARASSAASKPGSASSAPAPGPERGTEPVRSAGPGATWSQPDDAPPLEVDLRGMDVDEALRALDRGLDRGLLAGLSELRIIHGLGRGTLRAAVERHLKGHPQVASSRLGEFGEGGRGVTVARLR